MSAHRKGQRIPPALDLIEETVHLVRLAGPGPLLCYYAGGLPFILGLLYFWSDMGRSAFATQRMVQAALTMAILFVWMKSWHAVFASELRTRLLGRRGSPWGPRRILQLIATQAALQPSGLFVRPIAILIVLPYGWVRAYYENVTALGDGESIALRVVSRRAREQAAIWGIQNHVAISTLLSFSFFVWLNVAVAVYLAPGLLNTLLGIETQFSRSGLGMLNSTFFFTSLAIAYLCVDPLFKAFYVVRCFYGESLRSGEDLRVRMRRAVVVAGLAAVCFTGAMPTVAHGADETPAGDGSRSSHEIDSPRLDRAIDRILDRREYTWRMPPPAREEDKGVIGTFFADLAEVLFAPVRRIIEIMREFDGWMRDLLERVFPESEASGGDSRAWMQSLPVILYVVVGITVGLIVFLLVKRWREGRAKGDAVAEAVPAMPDLTSDHVTADELPEDGWLRLAQEMTAKGELRLALRALYLAGLAHLGGRQLITIARYKSDRDYARELQRRARTDETLLSAFGESLLVFERTWYGRHAVTLGTLDDFQRSLERIREC